jgi:hypothetical protein
MRSEVKESPVNFPGAVEDRMSDETVDAGR